MTCPTCGSPCTHERIDQGGAAPSLWRWKCTKCAWVDGDRVGPDFKGG
jgi:hypothetical protein